MPKENKEPFVRLTTAREAAELSQKNLADVLGVDPVSVNRWEHGESRPSWEYLRKISKVLSVSIDYLLENDEVETFDAEETELILKAANLLNKKLRRKN